MADRTEKRPEVQPEGNGFRFRDPFQEAQHLKARFLLETEIADGGLHGPNVQLVVQQKEQLSVDSIQFLFQDDMEVESVAENLESFFQSKGFHGR